MNVHLRVLKSKICGFQLESLKVRKEISQSSGLRRFELWNTKRFIGSHARDHLIAYALIKGVPYFEIERKTICEPSASVILKIIHAHVSWLEERNWTLERVQKLLTRHPASALKNVLEDKGGSQCGDMQASQMRTS